MATQAAVDKSFIVPLGPLKVEFIFLTDVATGGVSTATDADGNTVNIASKLANPQFVTAWVLNSDASGEQATAEFTNAAAGDVARDEAADKQITVHTSATVAVCLAVFGDASVK